MAKDKKESLHPAEQYARDVINGNITACKWVQLACERHVHDLEHGHERGLYFDADAAKRVLRFIGLLRHSKGKWGRNGGELIILESWEQFIIWVAFGWMNDKGFRRFRTLWIEVARKNGKTTLAAALGLYLAFADGEPAAEVYNCASKRDQARICHAESVRFVQKNPMLRRHIKIYKDNLSIEKTNSKYMPLGGDSNSTDGLNVSAAVLDEIHSWKSRDMWDVIETSTGSREQPLIIAITTAGMDRQSVCFEKHDYTRKILEGWKKDESFIDDTWFGIIFTLDEEDDWRDESVWIKANPNLGASKYIEDLRMKAQRAEKMPTAQNNFLRREMNIWVQGESKWADMDAWRECGGLIDALDLPEHLKDRVCYAGLDLSSTNDLTALALVFPDKDGMFDIVLRFWLPEDAITPRTQEGTHYDQWVREGYIEATDGNVIDYDWIFAALAEDMKNHRMGRLAYDRWGAARVVQVIQNMGIEVVQFGQGFASMNPPMKELERLILAHKIRHGNNPVLTWMMDNVVARMDPAGNIKPDKEKSKEKIDGAVALIMALDMALRADPAPDMSAIMDENWGM